MWYTRGATAEIAVSITSEAVIAHRLALPA
jgi:hypothetical protein